MSEAKKSAVATPRLKKLPDAFIPAPELNPHYNPMFQGPGTNSLVHLSSRRHTPKIDPITGTVTITQGDLTVFIDQWNSRQGGGGLRVSTFKLLDLCALALTSINSHRGNAQPKTSVSLTLDEYMRICGIPSTKPSKDRARRKVREDLETLFNISMEWSEPSGSKTSDYAKMRVITSQGIKSGQIMVNFSPEMAAYLSGAYVMQYPMDILKIDERNPAAYHIGRKLALHHSIEKNQKAGTANIISVKSLLNAAPDIPSHDEVASDDRHFDRRIITPFEKALESLADLISSWEYCNSKGVKLSEDQLHNFSYSVFRECYITFQLSGTPNILARILNRRAETTEKPAKISR